MAASKLMMADKPSRTTECSSAMRMRTGSGIRQRDDDSRPLSRPAHNREVRVDLFRTLAHAVDAEPQRLLTAKPAPIVLHNQHDRSCLIRQSHVQPHGAGVARG